MHRKPNFLGVAELIGDPSRAAMLLELLSGRSLPAGELAHATHIKPQTASTHLARLVEGGLLTVERSGRHRYYRLANAEIGHLLEAMNNAAPMRPIRSLRESDQLKRLRFARTCYDHLAGEVGVGLTARLIELGYMTLPDGQEEFAVTPEGAHRLHAFGIDIAALQTGKRRVARPCLDWSERRHHLAGALGAAFVHRLFELDWIRRFPEGRAVYLTDDGAAGLQREFGLTLRTAP